MIRGALFDMDGLLIDSERIYARGLRESAGELGYTISEAALLSALGTDDAETDRIFAREAPGYDGARMRQVLGSYLARHGYDRRMPLKYWAGEILRGLTARGVRCALVTSSPRGSAEAFLTPPGLFGLFSAVVTGDLGLPSKPAPDVYLRAAELLGLDIRRCAVLEDSYSGLRAGRAAGAVTVMVPDMAPYHEGIAPCCDFVAADLREAEAFLCR